PRLDELRLGLVGALLLGGDEREVRGGRGGALRRRRRDGDRRGRGDLLRGGGALHLGAGALDLARALLELPLERLRVLGGGGGLRARLGEAGGELLDV